MTEYISRETVNDLIEDVRNNHFILMCDRVTLALLKSKVAEIPAADVQPVDRWISVDDRLPEEQECVIVHEKDYGVMLGDYQGIKYSQPVWIVRKSGVIMRTTEVTHWQPLPKPPTNKI